MDIDGKIIWYDEEFEDCDFDEMRDRIEDLGYSHIIYISNENGGIDFDNMSFNDLTYNYGRKFEKLTDNNFLVIPIFDDFIDIVCFCFRSELEAIAFRLVVDSPLLDVEYYS